MYTDIEFDEHEYTKQNPMNYILDNIYLGNITAGTSHEILKNNKITAIVNLSNQKNNYPENTQSIDIMIDDIYHIDITPYLDDTYDFINKNNKNGNVLVHCQGGISRSTTIVIYYIMRKYQKSYKEALSLVIEKRRIVRPNDGFMRQLMKYQIE
jgi:protein-tyrosine phosphatase